MQKSEIATHRTRIADVIRATRGRLVTVDSAAKTLGVSRVDAAKALSRWTQQGWFSRIRRGLYAQVPLGTNPRQYTVDDPWTLVPELFDPAYISGWSAAQYWNLTEQIFRTIVICTARPVKRVEETIFAVPFRLKHVPQDRFFGLRSVWRGPVKIQVADPHRTILDMIEDPAIGGGIDHIASCLRSYLESEHYDPTLLAQYIDKMANGSINKRLGFLLTRIGTDDHTLLQTLRNGVTKGNVQLDPALSGRRLSTRWRVWIPQSWAKT